jgi:tetratricopeptide (TPR) repeat protein
MKQAYKVLLTFALALLTFAGYAQLRGQARLDSLLAVLPKAKSDTNKVLLLDNISWEYKSINPDEGIKYGKLQLALSQQLRWPKGIALSYNRMGSNYIFKSDYPNALEYDLKALRAYEAINDKTGIATVLGNIGNVYLRQSEMNKALFYYLKALRMNEELNNKKGIALNLGSIGLVYSNLDDFDKAKDYFLRGAQMNEELGNMDAVAIIYGNIGNLYKNYKDYAGALQYFKKACYIAEESGDKNGKSRYLGNLGAAYLAIAKDSDAGNASMKNKFGTRTNLLNTAIIYTDSAIALKKEIGELDGLSKKYKDLYDIYMLLGNDKKALVNYRNYTLYKDSVFNMEKDKKLTLQIMQYEFDKKETAIKAEQDKKDALTQAEIKKQKLVRNIFIGSFLLVLLFALVFFRQRNKIKAEKHRSDELNAELNGALKNLVDAQEQLVKAEKLAAFGSVASRMAHEIQNPLNFINNFSEISNDLITEVNAATTEEEKRNVLKTLNENLRKINQHGKRASSIVSQMQAHTRAGTAHEFFEEEKNKNA